MKLENQIFGDYTSGNGCNYYDCRADAEANRAQVLQREAKASDISHQLRHRDRSLRMGRW